MGKVAIAFSTLLFGFLISLASVGTASAAQQSQPFSALQQPSGLLQKVEHNYRRYCVKQYFICRDRWGNGPRFRRCLRWRDCLEAYDNFRARREARYERRYEEREDDYEERERSDYGHSTYSCRNWQNACAENWGYGNSDYYGCLKYHGCE